jgi:hypothetical protein
MVKQCKLLEEEEGEGKRKKEKEKEKVARKDSVKSREASSKGRAGDT